MILYLRRPEDERQAGEEPSADLHSKVEHLLNNSGKDGKPSVRGPLIEVPFSTHAKPLAALRDGDKLHIVAPADGNSVAGFTSSGLVKRLAELGLFKEVRLKQIHLIADNTGVGDAESFAGSFADALVAEGFNVLEIKAPRGLVRWNESGKIYISPSVTLKEPTDSNGQAASGVAPSEDPAGVFEVAQRHDAGVGERDWLPSNKTLNFYAGPEIQQKHRA